MLYLLSFAREVQRIPRVGHIWTRKKQAGIYEGRYKIKDTDPRTVLFDLISKL